LRVIAIAGVDHQGVGCTPAFAHRSRSPKASNSLLRRDLTLAVPIDLMKDDEIGVDVMASLPAVELAALTRVAAPHRLRLWSPAHGENMKLWP